MGSELPTTLVWELSKVSSRMSRRRFDHVLTKKALAEICKLKTILFSFPLFFTFQNHSTNLRIRSFRDFAIFLNVLFHNSDCETTHWGTYVGKEISAAHWNENAFPFVETAFCDGQCFVDSGACISLMRKQYRLGIQLELNSRHPSSFLAAGGQTAFVALC